MSHLTSVTTMHQGRSGCLFAAVPVTTLPFRHSCQIKRRHGTRVTDTIVLDLIAVAAFDLAYTGRTTSCHLPETAKRHYLGREQTFMFSCQCAHPRTNKSRRPN